MNRRTQLLIRLAFLALAICVVLPLRARAEVDASFLEALRERRLFELAEKECREQLARQAISPKDQAELTVELIRTYSVHAVHLPPDARAPMWEKARQTARDFLAKHPQQPRRVLVEVQDALTLLAQGESARHEREAGALTPVAEETAKQALRDATRQLETLDKQLTREIPLRRRGSLKPGELTADELFSLHQHVRQQLARAQQNRALFYEAGSEDRLSLLLAARQTLEGLLNEVAEDDPLAPSVRLDLAVCLRRLGDTPVADVLLEKLNAAADAPALRERVLAERIRVRLAAKDLAGAAALVESLSAAHGRRSAELEFAVLETHLALWRAAADAGRSAEATKWQQQVAAQAALLSQSHGAYWGRRADQLIASRLPQSGDVASAAILGRTADSLYRKGEFDQAVAAYEKGSEQALAAGDPRVGFELAYKAALVQQKRGLYADAAERLRDLSLKLRMHPQAAEAHRLAAWNAAQQARRDPSALATYEQILAEHADAWPKSATVGQMQLWLGRLYESQQKWQPAFEAFARVPADAPEFAAALASAAEAARRSLRPLRAADKPLDETLRATVHYFESHATRSAPVKADSAEAERLAALTAAELLLDFGDGQAARAEAILQQALNASPEAPADWRAAANARLVVALAQQNGKQPQAAKLLRDAAAASPAQLVEMIVGLGEIASQSSPRDRTSVAALMLQAIEQLESSRSQLDANSQLLVDRLHAEALAAHGQRSEAVALYAKLAAAHPDSAVVQEGYAQLLLDGNDPPSLQKALNAWRRIAARSRPHTDRWRRAKYSVALAQFKLGDRAAAAQLLRYMLETPPGLAGSGFEEEYAELLRKCDE